MGSSWRQRGRTRSEKSFTERTRLSTDSSRTYTMHGLSARMAINDENRPNEPTACSITEHWARQHPDARQHVLPSASGARQIHSAAVVCPRLKQRKTLRVACPVKLKSLLAKGTIRITPRLISYCRIMSEARLKDFAEGMFPDWNWFDAIQERCHWSSSTTVRAKSRGGQRNCIETTRSCSEHSDAASRRLHFRQWFEYREVFWHLPDRVSTGQVNVRCSRQFSLDVNPGVCSEHVTSHHITVHTITDERTGKLKRCTILLCRWSERLFSCAYSLNKISSTSQSAGFAAALH